MQDRVHPERDETRDWHKRVPVVARYAMPLTQAERDHCAKVAKTILPEKRLARDRRYFEPIVRADAQGENLLVFGDSGEIPRLAGQAPRLIEYRLSMLAGAGDLVVIGTQRVPAFEDYAEHILGLGHRHYLKVEPALGGRYVAPQIRCLTDAAAFDALRRFVQGAQSVTVIPYLASGAIWRLARRLAAETGTMVNVAGPLPEITRAANDKLVFSSIVRKLFGPDACPEVVSVHGAAALAGKVHAVARTCEKLVVKLPDSAGSAGNFPLFSSDVVGLSMKDLHRNLLDLVSENGTPPEFPMLVQVWQSDVQSSPSLQLWIPHGDTGPPIIEGVFQQLVLGQEGRFSGAYPAALSEPWIAEFCRGGLMLGYVFQELGYYGRCSFDAVLSGSDPMNPSIKWIECNGRWGGVSSPMTLLNRLYSGQPPTSYVIEHRSELELPRRPFASALKIVDDLLWRPGGDKGIIFLTPSGFEQGLRLHYVSIAPTLDAATAQSEALIGRLSAPT